MTHIVSRHVRVIPGEVDSETPDETDASMGSRRPGGRGFDYASLLGRRRALQRLTGKANTDAHAGSQGGDDDALEVGAQATAPPAPRPFAHSGGDAAADASANVACGAHADSSGAAGMPSPERLAIGARVTDAAAPVVTAVYRQQQRFVQLLGSLAREIGAFCGDPSIAEAGNWEVQLPLDQTLLPQTTLYLTLSRFSLQLRFDTPDTATRQLLLEHSALLERELDTLLRAWGEAREIELTVW
ncbi:type III secretion system protein SctP [Paraburkholderia sp. RL17-383-BIF-A]|uniref:type III secretion system protein SctP n=1 Tax=Burkholderiaceae TaxID=119060 RepID=UPI000895B943|nr:type III secretion system protein SctP [Burkholderia sp. WP9]SEB74154.1 type III secretion control protein HpaP [Burkholderia sp. WP9]